MPDSESKKIDEGWKDKVRSEKGDSTEPKGDKAAPQMPKPTFPFFIQTLVLDGLISLGEAPNPITGTTEKDLGKARFTIELIELIEEKTRGNLTTDEERMIRNILTDLRMRYVNAAREDKA